MYTMQPLYHSYPQRDWSPIDKLMFDEIADEYRRSRREHTYEDFQRWFRRRYKGLERYERVVWSYVLAL